MWVGTRWEKKFPVLVADVDLISPSHLNTVCFTHNSESVQLSVLLKSRLIVHELPDDSRTASSPLSTTAPIECLLSTVLARRKLRLDDSIHLIVSRVPEQHHLTTVYCVMVIANVAIDGPSLTHCPVELPPHVQAVIQVVFPGHIEGFMLTLEDECAIDTFGHMHVGVPMPVVFG